MAEIKPGYRTTEFWLAGVGGLLATVIETITAGNLPLPGWAGPVMMSIYALARGLAKLMQPKT